jgi:hypothetical protein
MVLAKMRFFESNSNRITGQERALVFLAISVAVYGLVLAPLGRGG